GEKPPPEPPDVTPYVPQGLIVGNAIASFRGKMAPTEETARDIYILEPGDLVTVTTVSSNIHSPQGTKLLPVSSNFVVCDYFKSEMSEYDSQYVFVPLDYLQRLRTMEDRVTSIQIKLKDTRDAKQVVDKLNTLFAHVPATQVTTWEHKQGP